VIALAGEAESLPKAQGGISYTGKRWRSAARIDVAFPA
jgi:hypothetical protein